MARTRPTAHKPGSKRSRLTELRRLGTLADRIRDDSWSEPVAFSSSPPEKKTHGDAAKSLPWMVAMMEAVLLWNPDLLDWKSLMVSCRLIHPQLRATTESLLEERVCHYFGLTQDLRQAAAHVVQGGWPCFVGFLAIVAHVVDTHFQQVFGFPAPILYRIGLAQQAMRRLDGTEHPLLFPNIMHHRVGMEVELGEWRYQRQRDKGEEEDDAHPVLQRIPTLERCFGKIPDDLHEVGSAEDGRLMLPGPIGIQSLEKSHPEKASLLQAHTSYIAANGKPGSKRQQLAAKGIPPFLLVAQDPYGTYTTFWVMTLNDDDEIVYNYLLPYHPGTADLPFGDGGGQTTSVVRSFSGWLFACSNRDALDWNIGRADPAHVLAWSLLAQRIGLEPFSDLDEQESLDKFQKERLWERSAMCEEDKQRLLHFSRSLKRIQQSTMVEDKKPAVAADDDNDDNLQQKNAKGGEGRD